MKDGKFWAIVSEYDLVGFEFGKTAGGAVRAFARKNRIPKEDAALLRAIDGDRVRDDARVPGRLISALEYGPEMAFGPRETARDEWKEYVRVAKDLKRRGIELGDIVDWVRVSGLFDEWVPVVK